MQKKIMAAAMFVVIFYPLSLCVKDGYPEAIQVENRPGNAVKKITDHSGRVLSFEKPFTRIISLYGAHTENLFRLGLDQEIIGVTMHEDYPPAALKKPEFSYREDPEKFLAARPDLVLMRPMIVRAYPRLVERLSKAGITTVSLQPGTVEEMFEYWRILGMLTGREAQARIMIADFKEETARIQALTAAVHPKKKVYFEAVHSKMKTFVPTAMPIFALETAGGINAAADAQPVRDTNIAYYGKERILSKSNEIDVYLAQAGAMNQPTVEMIKNESGFHVIKAVRENQIYLIDEMIVSRPTLRLLDGIRAIGQILYPDVFSQNDEG